MIGPNFFADFDLAAAAIWAFWIFFAILIVYLQTENMREGYPLTDADGKPAASPGLFPLPRPKTFRLSHGRDDVTVPDDTRETRDLALVRPDESSGLPLIPTGDPMMDGLGPAAWAGRRDTPELDAEGHAKIRPLSALPQFHVAAGRDPRGKAVVAGDGEVIGRVTDLWIDVPESLVRYLTIDVNPEGTGQTRLVPMAMARIKADRVTVRSLHEHNFADVPTLAASDRITLLEEDKIAAYYAGGTLYAHPSRIEPRL